MSTPITEYHRMISRHLPSNIASPLEAKLRLSLKSSQLKMRKSWKLFRMVLIGPTNMLSLERRRYAGSYHSAGKISLIFVRNSRALLNFLVLDLMVNSSFGCYILNWGPLCPLKKKTKRFVSQVKQLPLRRRRNCKNRFGKNHRNRDQKGSGRESQCEGIWTRECE